MSEVKKPKKREEHGVREHNRGREIVFPRRVEREAEIVEQHISGDMVTWKINVYDEDGKTVLYTGHRTVDIKSGLSAKPKHRKKQARKTAIEEVLDDYEIRLNSAVGERYRR